MTSLEGIQRQIEARELTPPTIDLLREKALRGLDALQEEAVRAQLYPPQQEEAVEPTVVEQAFANLVWVRKIMPVISEVLLKTRSRVEFTQGVFTNSMINCTPIGLGEKRHLGLTFGEDEIPQGEELTVLEEAWNKNTRGARRNIESLAKLQPLDVIGKAYAKVDRI